MLAPEAVSVSLVPAQMDEALAAAVTTGRGFTVTLTVATFEQPFASVPVTVYDVLAFGETVSVAFVPPELQE